MNKHSPLGQSGSLLERAAALYGLEVPTAAPGAPPPARRVEAVAQPQPVPRACSACSATGRCRQLGVLDRTREEVIDFLIWCL